MEDDAAGLVLRLALKTRFSEMGWGSTPPSSAKFCKCQQEKVTLSRFLRRTEIVEGNGVRVPGSEILLQVVGKSWTSIPSDVS